MKKTLFLLPLAMMGVLSTTISAPHANAAKVYKQTATVYQMKKTGKHYKIVSHTKKTTDQDINVGKTIVIKGQRYYYSHVFKGYINNKAYLLNCKLDAKRANVNNSFSNKSHATKLSNTNSNNNSNNDSNTTSNNDIKNGYDYKNDVIANYQTYYNVYIQTILKDINQHRINNNIPPLTIDSTLSNIANQRAKQGYDLRDADWYDGHHDQNGDSYFVSLAKQLGVQYTVMGENTASGDFSGLDGILEGPTEAANATVTEWFTEGPSENYNHYQNMMNPQFKKIGIGIYVGPNNGQSTNGGEAEDYTD